MVDKLNGICFGYLKHVSFRDVGVVTYLVSSAKPTYNSHSISDVLIKNLPIGRFFNNNKSIAMCATWVKGSRFS